MINRLRVTSVLGVIGIRGARTDDFNNGEGTVAISTSTELTQAVIKD